MQPDEFEFWKSHIQAIERRTAAIAARRQEHLESSQTQQPIKPKEENMLTGDKFYMVVDSSGDIVWRHGDKRLPSLEEALKVAEHEAREHEEDHYVLAAIRYVGTPKAPLTIKEL